jgi:hypothetical protein
MILGLSRGMFYFWEIWGKLKLFLICVQFISPLKAYQCTIYAGFYACFLLLPVVFCTDPGIFSDSIASNFWLSMPAWLGIFSL